MADVASKNDHMADRKVFDETKLGVKGLIDAGIDRLPSIFVNNQPTSPRSSSAAKPANESIPVIDLAGVQDGDPERRREIMEEVSKACEKWGFFQALNHGVPQHVLDEMIEGARRFHESDAEVRKKYYVRGDETDKKFVYTSNFYLYTGAVTNWRDTTIAIMNPRPDPEEIPETLRDITMEYSEHADRLGTTFIELLSEAMGLKSDHLKNMDVGEDFTCLTHYYPPCPQPELAIGINKHADNDIITILLQDEIGGLQVFHDDLWYDVPHIPGALVINTGDILQLLSNDKYKSIIHRVQSKKIGPRISVTCFWRPKKNNPILLGPIEAILSEENPPVYREITIAEYLANYVRTGQDYDIEPSLERFKIKN